MRKRASIFIVTSIFIATVFLLVGCNTGGGGGGGVPPFTDDFNRTDTSGRDLGSTDWAIYISGSTAATTMTITTNEVESHFSDGVLGIVAAYTGSVDYSKTIHMSVKFKIVSSGAVPATVAGLFMNLRNSDFASYYLQVNNTTVSLSEFDGAAVVGSNSSTHSITNDTWYILELDSSGDTLTGRLKDSGGNVLTSVSYTDTPRTYSVGELGFYNFTTSDGTTAVDEPVYFDDFSVTFM